MSDPPIVTVTATVMSGVVVRWQRALHGPQCLSASRDGVMVHGEQWLTGPHALPAAWVEDAHLAHGELAAGRSVGHMATHRRRGLTGPLEPVTAKPSATAPGKDSSWPSAPPHSPDGTPAPPT
jgi:hypothetical protein